MVLAKPAGTNPRALADLLAAELGALDEVTEAGVAGPGFINLRVADDSWRAELALIRDEAGDYGRSAMGQGRRVNVEYVSANPTGPMHRSEEHTSELQSLMRISYAVFCLKKKKTKS